MYATPTFITEVLHLVIYVATTVLRVLKVKVTVHTYTGSLVLLGWFL